MSFSVSDPNTLNGRPIPGAYSPGSVTWWTRTSSGLIGEILHFNNVARRQLTQGEIPDITPRRLAGCAGLLQHLPRRLPAADERRHLVDAEKEDARLSGRELHPVLRQSPPDAHHPPDLAHGCWRQPQLCRCHTAADLEAHDPRLRAYRYHPPAGRGPGARSTSAASLPQTFDDVILACHADQSRRMLDPCLRRPAPRPRLVRFSPNTAYLHRDASLMPERRSAWASWNVCKGDDNRVCVTYWMNRLQKTPQRQARVRHAQSVREPAKDKTFGVYEFDHPIYDAPSAAAAASSQRMQGRRRPVLRRRLARRWLPRSRPAHRA